jgi:hypothetical protein
MYVNNKFEKKQRQMPLLKGNSSVLYVSWEFQRKKKTKEFNHFTVGNLHLFKYKVRFVSAESNIQSPSILLVRALLKMSAEIIKSNGRIAEHWSFPWPRVVVNLTNFKLFIMTFCVRGRCLFRLRQEIKESHTNKI